MRLTNGGVQEGDEVSVCRVCMLGEGVLFSRRGPMGVRIFKNA